MPIQTRMECPIRFTSAGINPETIVEIPIISIKNVAILLILVFLDVVKYIVLNTKCYSINNKEYIHPKMIREHISYGAIS